MSRRNSKAVEVEAKVTLLRTNSSKGDSFISLSMLDSSSGINIVDCKIPLEAFSRIITGEGRVPVDATVFISEDFGKELEVETFRIPLEWDRWTEGDNNPEVLKRLREGADSILKEGWIMNELTELYPHKYAHASKTYPATFYRFKEVDEK